MKCQDFFENFLIFFYSLKLSPFRDNKRPVKQIHILLFASHHIHPCRFSKDGHDVIGI